MTEQKDAEVTSPHEHIKNSSIYAAILTEIKLETGRLLYNKGCKKDPHKVM